jgi:hypothetical protein
MLCIPSMRRCTEGEVRPQVIETSQANHELRRDGTKMTLLDVRERQQDACRAPPLPGFAERCAIAQTTITASDAQRWNPPAKLSAGRDRSRTAARARTYFRSRLGGVDRRIEHSAYADQSTMNSCAPDSVDER